MKDSCGTCRFFKGNNAIGTVTYGICRRRPPTVVPAPVEAEASTYTEWPDVTSEDWCGEFAPDTPVMGAHPR